MLLVLILVLNGQFLSKKTSRRAHSGQFFKKKMVKLANMDVYGVQYAHPLDDMKK